VHFSGVQSGKPRSIETSLLTQTHCWVGVIQAQAIRCIAPHPRQLRTTRYAGGSDFRNDNVFVGRDWTPIYRKQSALWRRPIRQTPPYRNLSFNSDALLGWMSFKPKPSDVSHHIHTNFVGTSSRPTATQH